MEFTSFEQSVIKERSRQGGEVLYFEDFAPYFIRKSRLQLSTYTQTAYIQLAQEDDLQEALSEYFQLIVFFRKLENNVNCFSIPYTALKDNTVFIGDQELKEAREYTIPDADLLIQLFQFAGKKYMLSPDFMDDFASPGKFTEGSEADASPAASNEAPSPVFENNLYREESSSIKWIALLFIFLICALIGVIGYHAHLERQQLSQQQADLQQLFAEQNHLQETLMKNLDSQQKRQLSQMKATYNAVNQLDSSLNQQHVSLNDIRYWNYRQSKLLEKVVLQLDSIMR